MPWIEGNKIVVEDNEAYCIELVDHKMHGQCVSCKPTMIARIHEKGGKMGGLTIEVDATSTHKAKDMAQLIAECIWAQAKAKEDTP